MDSEYYKTTIECGECWRLNEKTGYFEKYAPEGEEGRLQIINESSEVTTVREILLDENNVNISSDSKVAKPMLDEIMNTNIEYRHQTKRDANNLIISSISMSPSVGIENEKFQEFFNNEISNTKVINLSTNETISSNASTSVMKCKLENEINEKRQTQIRINIVIEKTHSTRKRKLEGNSCVEKVTNINREKATATKNALPSCSDDENKICKRPEEFEVCKKYAG